MYSFSFVSPAYSQQGPHLAGRSQGLSVRPTASRSGSLLGNTDRGYETHKRANRGHAIAQPKVGV